MESSQVDQAFGILLEELQRVEDGLRQEGARNLAAGSYDSARHAIDRASRLADFRRRVLALRREWGSLSSGHHRRPPSQPRGTSRPLPPGLQTPERAFRRPILEALVELGGAAPIGRVLDGVGEKMRGVLTEHDFQPAPSQPGTPRWRYTARWCRDRLIRDGLMEPGSPRGIWAISDSGRKALQDESPPL